MNKKIIIHLFILFTLFGYSQTQRVILSNGVEVNFTEEKRKGTKIILNIDKPICFYDGVTISVIDKVLEEYSERSSYLKNKVRFYYDRIEYETDGGYEKAILDLKNFIEYFNIGSSKVYLNELTNLSKKEAFKTKEEELAVNTMYPYFSYPFLDRNITSKKIRQLSNDYKNAIGTNNIKIQIFGRDNEKQAVKMLEKSFEQLALSEVDLNCVKIENSAPFFIYQPFSGEEKGIQMHTIYIHQGEMSLLLEGAFFQTFGKENIKIRSYDDFSEVHIVQKTQDNNGKPFLDRIKAFAKSRQLDYKKFGTAVTGNPEGIYKSFQNEDVTYLNEKGEKVPNPFVYRSIDLTGKEIVDRYLDAVADKKTIENIQSTRSKYDVVVNQDTLNLKVEFLNILPHRKLRRMILNDEDISYNVFDGQQGWVNKQGVIVDYTEEQVSQALAEEAVFPQQFYSPGKIFVEGLAIEENEKYKDERFYKLKVSLDDYTVYEYYNPTTGFLMKREFCKEAHNPIKTVYYSSYAKLNDLTIPHRLRIIENNQELKLTLTSFHYNTYILPSEFAKVDHFKLPQENDYLEPFDNTKKVEVEETYQDEEPVNYSVIENRREKELSEDPFQGIEVSSDQIKEQYDTNSYQEINRTREIKYLLVLSTMEDEEGANVMLNRLKRKGFKNAENIEMNGHFYTVEGNLYSTKREAQKRLNKIHKKVKGIWILEREY